MRKFFWGIIIAGAGALIWAHNLGYISLSFHFGRDWPVIIVAVGLMSIWDALFGRQWWGHKFSQGRHRREKLSKILEDLERGDIDAAEAAKRMG
ncbi:MAG: DUF5668 domain-containing protein [Elusimicrobia bacterium]|nr:DUF5668 domain-containing protein [Elusimicrobiota bacterium]